MYTQILIIATILSLLACGCDRQHADASSDQLKQFKDYGPEKVDIVGLSELSVTSGNGAPKLTLFVQPLDAFGSAIKTPCIFRVEMYEHVARSPSPSGKRLQIWPDIDLTDMCRNNAQWRDYLRAYEFNFDVVSRLTPGHVYIVEVTCLSPMGKRMSAKHELNFLK